LDPRFNYGAAASPLTGSPSVRAAGTSRARGRPRFCHRPRRDATCPTGSCGSRPAGAACPRLESRAARAAGHRLDEHAAGLVGVQAVMRAACAGTHMFEAVQWFSDDVATLRMRAAIHLCRTHQPRRPAPHFTSAAHAPLRRER
jgi:hypothetical protein